MLSSGCWLSIIVRFTSTERGSFFFHPLQFHFESTNLFIECRFGGRLLCFLLLLAGGTGENVCPAFLQPLFPLPHQRRMHIIFAGDLTNRFPFPHSFQCHPELELGAVCPLVFYHCSILHKLILTHFFRAMLVVYFLGVIIYLTTTLHRPASPAQTYEAS